MATQEGTFKFRGRIGGIIGYRDASGKYKAKAAYGMTKAEFWAAPCHENTRRCVKEFTTAAYWGTGIRHAANRVLMNCCMQGKGRALTLTILKNIRDNRIGIWGKRTIDPETIGITLDNFDFSDWGQFDTAFMNSCTVNIREDDAEVTFAAHHSDLDINQPTGATHYSFAAGCLMLSETPFQWESKQVLEPLAAHNIGTGSVPKIKLIVPNPTNGIGDLRMYIVGLHFWSLQNGRMMPVMNGRNNVAKVVGIQYG